MRRTNKYHKFIGYAQKTINEREESYGEKVKFKFDYVNAENRREVSNLFKGFEFNATTTYIITEETPQLESNTILTGNDRIWIDGAANIIQAIEFREVQKLGGQRFKNRKKVYLYTIG